MPEDELPPLPRGIGPRRRRGTPLWAKLWSLVILANLTGILVAIWVARLVRAVPESDAVETGLRFGYYAAILLIALLEALLVDELLFKGGFRITHLQGKSARFARKDEDVQEVAATLQRSSISFPITVLLCGLLTYQLFNTVNGDFDVYYDNIGKHVGALRGDDPEHRERRLEAIDALSIRRDAEIVPVLRQQLARGGEVGAWAAWALGRHTDLPSRRPLLPALVAASRGEDSIVRREALIALGRLQHRPMAADIQRALRAEFSGGPVELRWLYALGAVQVTSSIPLLEEILHRGDEDAQRMAAWTLAQHRDQRGGRVVVGILEARLPSATHPVRCAIVHSLGILADEASNLALMRAYDDASTDDRAALCSSLSVFMRPDGRDDRIDLLVPQEPFAVKVLKSLGQMRASTPEVRTVVEPWLERLVADTSGPPGTAEMAQGLLQGIREARDDSTMKSIDQAFATRG